MRLFATAPDWILLLLRLTLGLLFFPHGAQKLLGWFGGYGFAGTMGYFRQKFPAVLGLLAILAEFLGSLGLIAGFLTRIAAFGILCVMVVAVFSVHWEHGFFMNWTGQQKGEGFEFHLLVIAIAVVLLIAGGGLWSIDAAIAG
jgi:putative oxidoreductase